MRILAASFAMATALSGQLLDRIAVTVGTQVIAESAVLRDLRVGAFLDRAPLDMSPAAKRQAAQRLVDQVLILREAEQSRLSLPTEKSAAELLERVKADYGSPADFAAALKQYGIEEQDVTEQLLAGLIGISFTDLRFRPAVQVSEEDLRAYHTRLNDGSTFEAERDEIEEILTRQRTSDALDQWLGTARATARVQFREQVFQ